MKVFASRKPLTLFMAGQRLGKSHLIGSKSALYAINLPMIKGMIAANTYMQLRQSTMVAVKKVWAKDYGLSEFDKKGNPKGHYVVGVKPPDHFVKFSTFDSYHGVISFINGAIIYTASLDNYMAHDGKEIGWAELDETKDTKEEALKAVILARLSQPGMLYHKQTLEIVYIDDIEEPIEHYEAINPCCINTSPSIGIVQWLNDMFKLGEYEEDIYRKITDPNDFFYKEDDNKAVCIASTYWNEKNLPKGYIDNRLKSLSENEALKFVFGYPFAKSGKAYYSSFSSKKHVQDFGYRTDLPIHVTYDFNAVPYMTLLCAQIIIDSKNKKFIIRFFDEYCGETPDNTTERVTEMFVDDYGEFNPEVYFYGDASGDYRQAGNGDHTQFDTVRKVLADYISIYSDRVPSYNKGIMNRRTFMQKIFEGKLWIDYGGEQLLVEVLFEKECTHISDDFQWLKQGADGKKLKEKVKDPETNQMYEKYGHTSDAVEYLVCEVLDDYFLND
ncbi:hypothetical protein HX049_02620 [Myroides odoratimimus]|uniref:hypothetical protein n=1 Tax=Myroides odoratimimus TaxID=76832 RepID=UPI002578B9A8|nr:hypothetical protein [Myroides odoratimimus]MDM1396074.1 hypothetical protein [Myroides odoratimimus]